MIMAKPFLRWAGSKKRLLPQLLQHWDNKSFKGYIEPFVGSAQLYFSINPKRAILGDVNCELTNTYNQVKKNPEGLYNELAKLTKSKKKYYELREQDPNSLNEMARATRFIYLNRYCFNGLYRTNLSGKFNVPYGGDKTGNLPSLNDLLEISKYLQNAQILSGDFEHVVKSNLKKDDFVYLDPPYAVENQRVFRQYNPQTFGHEDLKRLFNLINHIDRCGNKFLVSYANCPEARSIFRSWNFEIVSTQRFMKGFGKDRKTSEELLIYNW